MDHRLFFRYLDPLDLLQLLDAALHLLGLRRLRPKAIDERLQILDPLALVLVPGNQLCLALFLLLQILRVVAGIDIQPLVPDLHRPAHRHIQKIPVVRDQNVSKRIRAQVLLQPVARLQIKMVRRLVQQQKIRPLQQQLRQRNPHLPAAGKLLRPPHPVCFAEP